MSFATLPLDQPIALSLIPTLVSVLPCRVAAGFPSPADDHAVQRVDLMAQLIKHPQATFLLRVRGESMKDASIFDNDVVLVDRAITARSDRSGHPIAKPNEIPVECGVMVFQDSGFEVARMAPKRTVSQLPFWVWMELAKATPRRRSELENPQVVLSNLPAAG